MEKKVTWILLVFLSLGASVLFAAETAKKENAFKEIASIEGRGILNFATTPAEFGYTFNTERKAHPKAWPVTYIPSLMTNILTRAGSSVYDVAILPWYARKAKDDIPLTRRFDLPDYVWQKE